VLGPFKDHKRAVNVRLYTQHDYRRAVPETATQWEQTPIAEANVTVEVWDVSEQQRGLSRHHVDLANVKQHGSVWHLQTNGNGFADVRLDMPRWVTPPMDLVLAIDLILYNYSHDLWMELQRDGTYRKSVIQSETLVLTAWVQVLASLFSPSHKNRQVTLLRQLDNEELPGWLPPWNPRPA
jgi:hypothetical protein